MKKRTVITMIICCLLICIGYGYLWFKPIIICNELYAKSEFLSDSLFNPIGTIDFAKGKNKIIIYTNWEDVSFLPENIKKWTLLECKDNRTIEQIKNYFEFEKISKDYVGTTAADSKIYFLKDNKVVFQSKIIIDNTVSLCFENTGWTFSTNYGELIKCFSEFRPVYFPIIKIN
jgi:hypothetical protein